MVVLMWQIARQYTPKERSVKGRYMSVYQQDLLDPCCWCLLINSSYLPYQDPQPNSEIYPYAQNVLWSTCSEYALCCGYS